MPNKTIYLKVSMQKLLLKLVMLRCLMKFLIDDNVSSLSPDKNLFVCLPGNNVLKSKFIIINQLDKLIIITKTLKIMSPVD